jgi:hypothetical protein
VKHLFGPLILVTAGAFLLPAAEPPNIIRASPTALAPGRTTEITFFGERLGIISNLWTSFPCTWTSLKSSSTEASFQITVSSNVAVQIGAVRLVGTNVLSDLHLLMIDDLPTAKGESAIPALTSGTAIDGIVGEMKTSSFTLRAQKAEEFSIELLAHRIGSALDPILRVLDHDGKELAYSLQYSEPNGDPRFRFRAPQTGSYTIDLRDVGYRGGASYFYHLRFGKFPIITAPFPPVIQRSAKARLGFVGPATQLVPVRDFDDSVNATNLYQNWRMISARSPENPGSGFGMLAVSDLPQIVESEPNDEPSRATKIKLPTGINGKFEKPRDRDFYEFDARKADHVIITARTRSLGVACDVSLRLLDDKGVQIAESTNTTASEGVIITSFANSGTFRLLVEELTGSAGPDFIYHLDIRPNSPGFTLSTENDSVEKTTNASVAINVSCLRDRFAGPVTLSIKGFEGCSVENPVMKDKKTNSMALRVLLPQSLPPAQVAIGHIQGEAAIEDQPYSTSASTLPALRKNFPMLVYPPEQFDGMIWLLRRN